MIWTAITAARAFLSKIPWQVWLVAAVLLTGFLWGNHRYSEGRADVEAEYAAARAKALAQARKADATARDTVDRDKALSGAEIERGREAAADADDPWKAATEAMR
jgi:hypothetical protein